MNLFSRICKFLKSLFFFHVQNLNKIYCVNVPLILMNSFNTEEDTQRVIRKYKGLDVDIYTFNQSCYPRLSKDSLLPIAKNCNVTKDLNA